MLALCPPSVLTDTLTATQTGKPSPSSAAAELDDPVLAAGHPHIRSYTLRRGHITAAQRRAYATQVPGLQIPYRAAPLDPAAAFGRDAPVVLEIGFGMGETTAQLAAAHPQLNFLGVEVYVAGIGALARRVQAAKLTNIRLIEHDAVEVVRDMLAPQSLYGIHVFFPDPWPKLRHHKRRLLTPPFVAALAQRLRPGGTLHCATDWEDYAQHMLTVLSAEALLRNLHLGYAPEPRSPWCERPSTKFQARGQRLGHGIWDLVFARV